MRRDVYATFLGFDTDAHGKPLAYVVFTDGTGGFYYHEEL